MAFYCLFFCGVAGGVLGGMGMGGGTILIPLLTIFCGVEQGAAQGINLLAFLPASFFALRIHSENGLLETKGLSAFILPALLFSAAAAFAASLLPAVFLRRAFGLFLTVLALIQLYNIQKNIKIDKKIFLKRDFFSKRV